MNKQADIWGIIYNPKAGSRKTKKRWQEIKQYLDARSVHYDYVQSEGFGSVERLTKMLIERGYQTLVIVGGDGALNDALNGLMSFPAEVRNRVSIGIIPNGVGNDFASYWTDDLSYAHAIDSIIARRTRRIDVGCCRQYAEGEHKHRYFINSMNIGLGARIVKITDQTWRFWGFKLLAYAAALFLTFFERKHYRMHLRINGDEIRGRLMTVCIGNAGGYSQTPSAVPYNGWLDVSIVHKPSLWQVLTGAIMLIRRRILNHKVVTPYRTKKVKVIYARNAAIDLDGRLQPQLYPIEVTVVEEAVNFILI